MASPDLERQVADLNILLEVSRKMGATTELEPLLHAIEQAAIHVLSCERATVFLYDKSTDELYSKVATGVDEIRFPVTMGIAGEAARTRKIINVPDAYADPRFNRDVDKQTGYRTHNLLSFPLTGYDDQLVGVLQVLNKRQGGFDKNDERLASTLSSQAGVSVQRQMLLEEFAEKQKLERDLALARTIQQNLLPKKNPSVDGFDIAGWNNPADQTGGDCYDFIPLPDGRLGLLLADATGHGIGPALVISVCRAFLRSLSSVSDDLEQIMSRTNALLKDDLSEGRFVTTFFGFLDTKQACLNYIAAGQGPLLYYQAATGKTHQLSATTIPLGIMSDLPHEPTEPIRFRKGDVFALVTDGFFEWARPDGQQYGCDRIFDLIRNNPHVTCEELIRKLHESVKTFAEGTPQSDDLTAILIKKL